MKKKILLYVLFFTGMTASYANDSFSYRETGSGLIVLSENMNVSMEYENLEYSYEKNEYSITYRFSNISNVSESVLLAFPVSSRGYVGLEREYYDTAEKWLLDTYKFKTYIEGRMYIRQLEKIDITSESSNYDYAFTLEVEMPGNSTLEINDVYNSKGDSKVYYKYYYPESNDLKTQIFYSEINIDYLLSTANNWKGDIGSFHTNYSKILESPYISIGNNIYIMNNEKLLSLNFSSNYSELSLDESENQNQVNYTFSKTNFSPEKNLVISTIEKKTTSLNALLLSGSIYKYINGERYNTSHIHYILKMLNEIFPEEQMDEILYRAIIELDKSNNLKSINEINALEMVTLSRFYLNLQFARAGYRFSNNKWEEMFKYYNWYIPTTKNVAFDDNTTKKIEVIKEIRSKYQVLTGRENSNIEIPSLKIEFQGK